MLPGREKGSGAVPPAAIVWPCPLAVDAHAAVTPPAGAGRFALTAIGAAFAAAASLPG